MSVSEETLEACMSCKSHRSFYLFGCSYIFLFHHIFLWMKPLFFLLKPRRDVIWSATRETGSLRESLREWLKFKPIMNTASSFSLLFFHFPPEHTKPAYRESSGESLILQPLARKWSLCSSPDTNTPFSPCPLPLGFIHLIAWTLDDRESRYCWPQITQKALLKIWDSLLSLPFYRTVRVTFIPYFIPQTRSLAS